MADKSIDDVKAMSFEVALAPLAESIAIYERGEALKGHCETLLKSAEARIEKITLGRDGKPTRTEPLDA